MKNSAAERGTTTATGGDLLLVTGGFERSQWCFVNQEMFDLKF